MEKFINEKDYLIIIAISPKYYETVTGALINMENDERTLNTVYIHKQLQNEFIQNGCRNFRFIPILFPGAKKVPCPHLAPEHPRVQLAQGPGRHPASADAGGEVQPPSHWRAAHYRVHPSVVTAPPSD
uniref:SEFIR domain-containing protein n=1 Tax=Anguilla anguilla TaxID=7936 RepID=A0A0E9WXB4_ANGAN